MIDVLKMDYTYNRATYGNGWHKVWMLDKVLDK